jgi:hypothetical protein
LLYHPRETGEKKKDMFQERYGVYNPVKTTVMVLRIGYSYHTVNGVEATTVLGTKWTHSHTIYVKRWKTHVSPWDMARGGIEGRNDDETTSFTIPRIVVTFYENNNYMVIYLLFANI